MKIKMNICASTKERVYNHNETYEVGKHIDKKLAESFLRVNYATVVEEEVPLKEAKPKKTTKKKKNED